jgi:hypothetical protein
VAWPFSAPSTLSNRSCFFLSCAVSPGEEDDGKDELLCVANRQTIVDDELWSLWKNFVEQVRIVLLTDSCHSGTVARALPRTAATRGRDSARDDSSAHYEWEAVPHTRSRRELSRPRFPSMGLNKPEVRTRGVTDPSDMVAASLIHISGCRDEQESFGSKMSSARDRGRRIAESRNRIEGYFVDVSRTDDWNPAFATPRNIAFSPRCLHAVGCRPRTLCRLALSCTDGNWGLRQTVQRRASKSRPTAKRQSRYTSLSTTFAYSTQ